tara:strand:+ start:177 stop:371 length:195 start_codon:yes stop_codon:yes gene_type:complete
VLPEEINKKMKKATNQIENNNIEKFLLVLADAKNLELDNSKNSFVGCCSLGTGHFELFINQGNL